MPLSSRCPSPLNGSIALICHPGNLQAGVHIIGKSMDSRLKILGMTEGVDSLNASITPCLSPLNASIRGPQYLKTFGFPIKDFGNDG